MFETIFEMAPFIIKAVLGFSFVIFIHELGHFLFAKKVGVRVEIFSVGMGKRLFGFKRGDTDYRICLLPFGGYVKMVGQEDTPGAEKLEGKPWEYPSKTVGERLQIIVAGVTFNFLSSFVFLFVAAMWGINVKAPEIGEVQENMPAYGKVQPGSKILAVGDRKIRSFEEFQEAVVLSGAGKALTLHLEKDGKVYTAEVTPKKTAGIPIPVIGVTPAAGTKINIHKRGIAEAAGLQDGDEIVAVNGVAVLHWHEVEAAFNAGEAGKSFDLSIKRDEKNIKVTLVPELDFAQHSGLVAGTPAYIHVVSEGYPAAKAGILPGDRITALDNKKITVWNQMIGYLSKKKAGEHILVEIERNGQTHAYNVLPTRERGRVLLGIQHDEDRLQSNWRRWLLGDNSKGGIYVGDVKKGSPAETSGLMAGDQLTHINGEAVQTYEEYSKAFYGDFLAKGRKGELEPVKLTYIREGQIKDTTLAIVRKPTKNALRTIDVDVYLKQQLLQYDVAGAFSYCLHEPISLVKRTYQTLYKLVSGRLSPKLLGGPVLIVKATYLKSKEGFGSLLQFLALISVNLAVINMLPIPIMDGGHVVLLLVEKFKGGPVGMKTQVIYQYVGAAFLMTVMGFVMLNDVLREFGIGW